MQKRICFVIATLSSGGAERTVSNIVTHLPEEYQADILLNDTASITYPYKGNILSLGMRPKSNKISLRYQAKVLVRRIFLLRKIKKENGYLAVLSFSDSANIANILSGNRYCKVIASIRINLSKTVEISAYRYIVNPLARLLYNKADRVVAVSKGVECDLLKNFKIKPQKLITICNGYDYQFISEKANEPLTMDQEKWFQAEHVLVTMGRLEHSKGQWHLIRALRILEKKGLDFKLLILGHGEYKKYLSDLVNELHLNNKVVFCGFQENPFKIIKQAEVYVFPSLFEGFPNALAEAMCCGVPCISSDFDSGAREILAPNTDIEYKNTSEIEYAKYGVIVPCCDGNCYSSMDELSREEELLGEALFELLNNRTRYDYYKSVTRERGTQLDINEMVKNWIKICE